MIVLLTAACILIFVAYRWPNAFARSCYSNLKSELPLPPYIRLALP